MNVASAKLRSFFIRRKNDQENDESLLAEYQAGVTAVETQAFWGWQMVVIMYGAALAGLVFLITAERSLATSVATTGAAVLAILLLEGARRIVLRAGWTVNHIWRRLRDIEWRLGMRTNIYVSLLADWNHRCANPDWHRLSDEERTRLAVAYAKAGGSIPGPKATVVVSVAAWGLQASWLLLVAWRWLEHKGLLD